MKYVNYDLVKNYIEEKQPVVTNGEFGYNRIEKFYFYQRSMVPPTADSFAFKFYDFDVVSYRLPYFGDLQETNEIDILEYIKYVMEHIEHKLLEEYKKDLQQYWSNQKHNVRPRSRHRAEKVKSLFEKENSQNMESRDEDILSK